MTICPTCHLQQPCDCPHDVPARNHEPTERPRLGTQLRRTPPPIRRHRPDRAIDLTTDDGTCPLDHGENAAPQLHGGRTVCPACVGRLRRLLDELPSTLTDLDDALAKLMRFPATSGNPLLDDEPDEHLEQTAAETPLLINPDASEAAWVARQTILANVDWVATVRGHDIPDTWPAIAAYLTDALDWVSRHPHGPQVVDELRAALSNARHATDRPADRVYVGRCNALVELLDVAGYLAAADCTEELYARPDRPTVTCPRCGTEWGVRGRQDALLAQMRDHVLPAVDVARAVAGLGQNITPEAIWQWKRRGRLSPALNNAGNPRADVRGRPLYRVGDVLDLIAPSDVSEVSETVRP